MNEWVFYTNNAHKVKELNELAAAESVEIVPYQKILGSRIDVVEDGTSFSENAYKKLQALAPLKDRICLAEDSGLEVLALQGAPGIYSARYAGENASRKQMCEKILTEMQGEQNRKAQYRAVFALRLPGGSFGVFEGVCKGTLALEMKGEGGFGYDPIFIPEGYDETFGQLPIRIKHQLSHRFQAFQKLLDFIVSQPK